VIEEFARQGGAVWPGGPLPGDGAAMGRYAQRFAYDAVGNIDRVTHARTDPAAPGWTQRYTHADPSPLQPAVAGNRLTSTRLGAGAPCRTPTTRTAT
jgi:hypothetical protein